MTRKKVKLAYITNDSARKATFKKRKKGLMKKMSELSTLCGIQTCAIIYCPYDSQPEVWPSAMGVQRAIVRFKKMPEAEQSRKMVNQDSFLRQRISKAEEQLKKQQRENREKEMTQVMYRSLVGDQGLQNLSVVDLKDLGWLVEKNIEEIEEKIKSLQAHQMPPPQVVTATSSHMISSTHDLEKNDQAAKNTTDTAMDPTVQNQQWLTELLKPNDQNVGFGRNEDMMEPQNHQWLMDLLKSNENVGFGKNEDMLPYGFNGNGLWSSFPFP
ncbi:agamous-like MADS-box protein AGL80 [Juglans microcarpa x Juglans regia]|uniref:agamous-like MADS-box protein AGL80 n=1 Tax=Juglans microcarpa x Juglans regia TaxID=2249226 RepID=UPI001B7E389F|nr:agamous-like MADS-box protein AGL80 [Juglans microcarpa x Juglans regia]